MEQTILGIPQSEHLLRDGSRQDLVTAVKEARRLEWEATHDWVMEQINEVTGLDISIRLTRATDDLVVLLFRRALIKVDAPPDAHAHIGLFATGGYGRGELNPSSDLDVLVCAPRMRMPDWVRACYQEFTTLLWDTGFKVGGALRGLDELEHIIKTDFVTATAVIEQRCLFGHQDLQQGMRDLLDRFRSKRSKPFLQYKVEELQERQGKAGASLFRMEPDLKTNPGCLRDLQLLQNISWMLCGERLLRGLVIIDGMERSDIEQLYRANDFLLKLRSLQHFHHGRLADQWTLRDQLRIAGQLGYSEANHLRAVELMMRDYYLLLRQVVQLMDLTISHLTNHGHLGRRRLLIKTRRRVSPGFVAVAGKVYCTDQDLWERSDCCLSLMRMCRATQRAGFRLSYVLKRSMREQMYRIDDQARCDPETAALFMTILSDTGSLAEILQDMHESEFLGTYLPEFGKTTCLMQFDAYHHYTVDQHTLFAMGNLARLWQGNLDGLPDMRQVLRETVRRDLLALALLMHDVGKFQGRGHSQRGAVMITGVAARLGLDQHDTDCLYRLVLHHVLLSNASRSRDISDPELLTELAEHIGSRFNLDMLYCLTYCDTLAVAEGLLTGWQAELLAQLYQQLRDEFRRRPDEDGPAPQERFRRRLLAAGLHEGQVRVFLDAVPDTYVYQADPNDALRHIALFEEDAELPRLHYSSTAGSVLLDVLMPDGVGVFAALCAVLTGRGCDIEDARIWSLRSGSTLTRLRLEAAAYAAVEDATYWARTREHVIRCLEDPQHGDQLLQQRRSNAMEVSPADSGFNDPSVRVDQQTSSSATILDVQEKDDVGLLSGLCRIIAENGCSIEYASIATMGDVALDVFYVTREGNKLSDAEAADLQQDIEVAYHMAERH
ncbi:MAG: [protein-PII] uridylyltransferase [Planctomycetota bacterium]